MKSNWKISFLLFIFVLFFLPGYERHHHVFIPGSVWRVGVSWSSSAVTPWSEQSITLCNFFIILFGHTVMTLT